MRWMILTLVLAVPAPAFAGATAKKPPCRQEVPIKRPPPKPADSTCRQTKTVPPVIDPTPFFLVSNEHSIVRHA